MAVIPSAYNALMGMFSPRQPQNVSGSIYDMARADAQRQMLAQIGGGLMAAAVPQTATMRAQALQAALGNMGNIGNSVYNAAQLRLAEQKQQQEAQLRNAAAERLKSLYGDGVAESVELPSQPSVSSFGPRVQQPVQPSPQSEIGALVNPNQARIAAPPVPSASATRPQRSSALTLAQIARVRDVEALEGPIAAANLASELQYKNAQPPEPKGELALGVAALQNLGISQDRINDFINKSIDGQPTEFSKNLNAYLHAPEGSEEKKYLGNLLQQQTGQNPEYYAPQEVDTPSGKRLTQYPKSGAGSAIDLGPVKTSAEVKAEEKAAELDVEKKAFQPKALRAIINTETKALDVMESIDRALTILRESPQDATGLIGSAKSKIPGTAAFNLVEALKTVQGNIGFDRLQQMRLESPTGGALGQVAVKELEYLQGTKGSLDIGQNPETLIKILTNIASDIDSMTSSMYDAYNQDYGDGSITRETQYSMDQIYSAPQTMVDALRNQYSDDAEFKREFDKKFGRNASKYYLGGM